jgi:hypothetical protein
VINTRRDDVTRRWALRLTACLLAGAAVLTGCSEKQEASESLPTTSSAEPTEDALPPLGPEDLPMPDEARTQDAAGAEAFVRYYIELINRTSTVMDAQPLRDLSDGCRDCNRIADNVERDMAAGLRRDGGELSVTGFGAPMVEGSTSRIAIVVDQSALRILDGNGADVPGRGSVAYSELSGGAALRWEPGERTWLITNFTLG